MQVTQWFMAEVDEQQSRGVCLNQRKHRAYVWRSLAQAQQQVDEWVAKKRVVRTAHTLNTKASRAGVSHAGVSLLRL